MPHFIITFLDYADYYLSGPAFILLLMGTGLFFTLYLRFPQARLFKRSVTLLLGKDKQKQEGDVSVLQSLANSLASSIGAGTISGVAMAIHIGGPSSVFWICMNGFLGMATRMAETMACHRYREKTIEGSFTGGPMYFLDKRLGMPTLGVLFALGAILTTFLGGNLPQVNGMTALIAQQWGIDKRVIALLLTFFVGIVILGGIKRISQVTELLVPFMTVIYIALSFSIIAINYKQIGPSLYSMFAHPFRTAPAVGGFLGASFSRLMQNGINYGFFTNDSGTGSAPIAHCASKEKESGKVAIMSMIEPFISTCLLCTLTALAIISTGKFHTKVDHVFDTIDIEVIAGDHTQNMEVLHKHVATHEKLPLFTGSLTIAQGKVVDKDITVLHNYSLTEEIAIRENDKLFSGTIAVIEGHIVGLKGGMVIRGKSIVKEAKLGLATFSDTPYGWLTAFLMILCFLLFAFSTVIAYCYFGDRALVYLGGGKYLLPYKLFFVGCVFIGSILEATLIWRAAVVACAMMAIPNLIGLLLMRKEIKESIEKASGQ